MIRVLFLIRSLGVGGAERQLVELVKGLDKERFQITLVTFYDGGPLRAALDGVPGVTVESLHKQRRWDLSALTVRLGRIVRRDRPHIIHGYMGVANELALFAGRLVGARVLWGLRASNMDLSKYGRISSVAFRAGAVLSRFPDCIIVNSEAGRQYHAQQGFRPGRMVVISNGINTLRFRPDPDGAAKLRSAWRVLPDEFLIGIVGRLDPMKDHATFLHAAALLHSRRSSVRFVCVGGGPVEYAEKLVALSGQLGLERVLTWHGSESDMAAAYSALDVSTSSSISEGFSNVIGEAMGCAVPCVVTDVGDSKLIVGDAGIVIPPRRPQELADAWERLLSTAREQRSQLGDAARSRVTTLFSSQRMVSRTEEVLGRIVDERKLAPESTSRSPERRGNHRH